jgi:hypothetical protein
MQHPNASIHRNAEAEEIFHVAIVLTRAQSILRGARRPRTVNRRHAAEPNRKGWRAVCRSAPGRLRQ